MDRTLSNADVMGALFRLSVPRAVRLVGYLVLWAHDGGSLVEWIARRGQTTRQGYKVLADLRMVRAELRRRAKLPPDDLSDLELARRIVAVVGPSEGVSAAVGGPARVGGRMGQRRAF